MRKVLIQLLTLLLILTSSCASAQSETANMNTISKAPAVESFLLSGNLAAGETTLSTLLLKHPHDDQLRFGLGTLQFLRALEQLMKDLHRYGLKPNAVHGLRLPIFRLPVAENPNPETLTYEQWRRIIDSFSHNLAKSEATLALIADPSVTLPLHFGLIKLDLTGDGKSDEGEALWRVFAELTNDRELTQAQAEQFYIKFDRGDVHWLRGYCHLLMTVCETFLAYNSRETFNSTAHLFFAKADTPYPYLAQPKSIRHWTDNDLEIVDLIALVHTISWPVAEPSRMTDALHHMESVVAQSNETWKWILAETDDDHEWLPNPHQTGVIPNVRVTQEMVTSWSSIMSEIDSLLKGETLIPFWRGSEPVGINLRKVFLAPEKLDVVLWVQGAAAKPYLETGRLSKGESWRSYMNAFGSSFPGFALWFN